MAKNGEKLSWHVLSDGQNLRHTKEGWVHTSDPIGNIARVIHPGYITNGGIKSGEEGRVKELCAVCRLDSGRKDEFGIFNSNDFCQNCGSAKHGNGLRVLSWKAEDIAEDPSFHDESSFQVAGVQKSICGSDGLPRKVYIRDVILREADVFENSHYSSLGYREIKNWEDEGLTKPESFDENGKYKYLKLVNFKAEKSPLSIEEIQKLIDCPNIIVMAA